MLRVISHSQPDKPRRRFLFPKWASIGYSTAPRISEGQVDKHHEDCAHLRDPRIFKDKCDERTKKKLCVVKLRETCVKRVEKDYNLSIPMSRWMPESTKSEGVGGGDDDGWWVVDMTGCLGSFRAKSILFWSISCRQPVLQRIWNWEIQSNKGDEKIMVGMYNLLQYTSFSQFVYCIVLVQTRTRQVLK